MSWTNKSNSKYICGAYELLENSGKHFSRKSNIRPNGIPRENAKYTTIFTYYHIEYRMYKYYC